VEIVVGYISLRNGWGNTSRSSVWNENGIAKGIKIREIKAEDVSQIVAIQESIIQKKVSRKWI
jgi:hypothetical protein